MGWFSNKKKRPDASEAAIRAIILRHVVAYAFMMPERDSVEQEKKWWTKIEQKEFSTDFKRDREMHWNSLKTLKKHLSPLEHSFSRQTAENMADSMLINATLRTEALTAILWALQVIPELPAYDTQATPALFGNFFSVEADEFINNAGLRPVAEIDEARSFAETWHWRSRTRQLIEDGRPFPSSPELKSAGFDSYDSVVRTTAKLRSGEGRAAEMIDEDFAAFGKAYRDLSEEEWPIIRSITMERHLALNWLCGYAPGNRWDETPIET